MNDELQDDLTAASVNYADLPISHPQQDLFGVDPFAQSLASSIQRMASPEGVVIALNGVWGSGKSSAINLIKHHLTPAVEAAEIQLIAFNPWWFRGEEALVLAFFRELHAATKPTLATRAKKVLPKLGARLMKGGGVVGAAADVAGASGAGRVASAGLDWLSDLIEDKESVETLHDELSAALRAQEKRFVVFIDDIDRLAPDEAVAMFRMVKSVGRLPNLIYVLAFDRALAERVVADRYPSEGPHYLEKIVQVAFELPPPEAGELQEQLLSRIGEICGLASETQVVEVMNLFYEIVAPQIRTPRDVFRLVNGLSVTWPAVAGEVHLGDFIAIEAIRLFEPNLYHAIRSNPDTVCGSSQSGGQPDPDAGESLNKLLLAGVSDKSRHRKGLIRLFPKLESIWSNVYHTVGRSEESERRVCVKEHFPTYFRFTLGADVVSQTEVSSIIERADDQQFVREKLLQAVGTFRRRGGTRAAILLDSLISRADKIPLEKAADFLAAVFSVADDLDVEADGARGFSFGDNRLRTYWLMRELLFGRTTVEERSPILMKAAKQASLGWLVYLAHSAWDDYHPREGKEVEAAERCPLTLKHAARLKSIALGAVKRAANDGSLLLHKELARLMFVWLNFTRDDGKSVRRWTSAALASDAAVIQFARGFTSHSWTQGMGGFGLGDLVAKRSDRASVQSIHEIMDRDRFRQRVEELAARDDLAESDSSTLRRFLTAWEYRDEHGDW